MADFPQKTKMVGKFCNYLIFKKINSFLNFGTPLANYIGESERKTKTKIKGGD